MPSVFDVVILGAGAAGLMAAAQARRGGASVIVLDHAAEPGRKILISGGGRCNFTNLQARSEHFISSNPAFSRSALARYTPRDFLNLVERHGVAWCEKAAGQLSCQNAAREIVQLLLREAEGCTLRLSTSITAVTKGEHFVVTTITGQVHAKNLVLATGGLAIPKLGATDLSLRVARQFGLPIVPPAAALVPLVMACPLPELAGVSLLVKARMGKRQFTDGMVVTHRGLSGPAILQISSYLASDSDHFSLNLLPLAPAEPTLLAIKKARPRAEKAALLSDLPQRLARYFVDSYLPDTAPELANIPGKLIRALAGQIEGWRPKISGNEGFAKAEVMRGGIDTAALSSQTMEASSVGGLFAVGEAVDVTGWLGGYNFQWAWSSGYAAGRAIAARL